MATPRGRILDENQLDEEYEEILQRHRNERTHRTLHRSRSPPGLEDDEDFDVPRMTRRPLLANCDNRRSQSACAPQRNSHAASSNRGNCTSQGLLSQNVVSHYVNSRSASNTRSPSVSLFDRENYDNPISQPSQATRRLSTSSGSNRMSPFISMSNTGNYEDSTSQRNLAPHRLNTHSACDRRSSSTSIPNTTNYGIGNSHGLLSRNPTNYSVSNRRSPSLSFSEGGNYEDHTSRGLPLSQNMTSHPAANRIPPSPSMLSTGNYPRSSLSGMQYLLPSRRNRSSNQNGGGTRRPGLTGDYKAKAILLKEHHKETPLTEDEECEYSRLGLIRDLVVIPKHYTQDQVFAHLENEFNDKLQGNIILSILKRNRSFLRPLELGSGLTLSCATLAALFKQQTLYLRPLHDIICDDDNDLDTNRSSTPESSPNAAESDFNVGGESPPSSPHILGSPARNEELSHELDTEVIRSSNNDAFHALPLQEQTLVNTVVSLRAQINESERFHVRTVRGNEFLSSAIYFAEPAEDLKKKIKVTFANEAGIDTGGLTREFFHGALRQIEELQLFQKDNEEAENQRLYHSAGAVIALSIIYGGPSPKFFKEDEVKLIIDAPIENPDGGPQQSIRGSSFQEFLNGLGILNTLETIRVNKGVFSRLFLAEAALPLGKNQFVEIFEVKRSTLGSNNFKIESRVNALYERFLQEIEDKKVPLTFETMLSRCTGLESVPPIGFTTKPQLVFNHNNPNLIYPEFGTCEMKLSLPVKFISSSEYQEFKENFIIGVRSSAVYGSV